MSHRQAEPHKPVRDWQALQTHPIRERFYSYVVQPCREVPNLSPWNAETALAYARSTRRPVEVCEASEAQFWTVYGLTHPNDEHYAICDCPAVEYADQVALALMAWTG